MVPAVSALDGVKVSTVSALLNDALPDTAFPLAAFTVNDAVLGTTASENVTVGSTETGLLDDPAPAPHAVTDGAPGGRPCTRRRPSSWSVEGVRREGVGRAVGVDPAAGQRGQRPVGHGRAEPARGIRVVAGWVVG